jgi:hypothetical protein
VSRKSSGPSEARAEIGKENERAGRKDKHTNRRDKRRKKRVSYWSRSKAKATVRHQVTSFTFEFCPECLTRRNDGASCNSSIINFTGWFGFTLPLRTDSNLEEAAFSRKPVLLPTVAKEVTVIKVGKWTGKAVEALRHQSLIDFPKTRSRGCSTCPMNCSRSCSRSPLS